MSTRSSKSEFLWVTGILSGLNELSLERLAHLEIFETLDSTNTYLLQQVKLNGLSGQVCFAEEQTAGRGRLGRVWYSPKGSNIYCSLSWRFQEADVSSLSIAIAVMIARVLHHYGIKNVISLKWPNDVLCEGRKLAGILLERTGSFVVIGIGLNVSLPKEADAVLAGSSIDLSEITGKKIERNRLCGLLLNELFAALPLYAEKGLSPFLEDWRQRDVLVGRIIHVHTPAGIITGEMRGINDAGELMLLDEEHTLRYFRCGEVSVRGL